MQPKRNRRSRSGLGKVSEPPLQMGQDGETGGTHSGSTVETIADSLRYAVIGDSIQWGQGLLEQDKFSSLVAKQIESVYGVSMSLTPRYAHSGAALGSSGNAADARRTDDGDFSPRSIHCSWINWKACSTLWPWLWNNTTWL